jgi:hypothetical protein
MKALHAQVTEDEQHKARLRAAELGMSIANYVRKLVQADIENEWLTIHGPRALVNEGSE